MHGKNSARPFDNTYVGGGMLQVHEIFYTIQGEGPFFGMPAVFVRLTGCNLQCHFCDTVWDDDHDQYVNVADLAAKVVNVAEGKTQLVVLTGGEPARQDLSYFISKMHDYNFQVQLETAGTFWQECFRAENVTIVCSPKTKNVHKKFFQYCRHWKYVVRAHESGPDGLPDRTTQLIDPSIILDKPLLDGVSEFKEIVDQYAPLMFKHGVPARPDVESIINGEVTVWLSPCDEGEGREKATLENHKLVGELCLRHGYRAQVQLHKILQLP